MVDEGTKRFGDQTFFFIFFSVSLLIGLGTVANFAKKMLIHLGKTYGKVT